MHLQVIQVQPVAYFHAVYHLALLNKYKWTYISVWGNRISRLQFNAVDCFMETCRQTGRKLWDGSKYAPTIIFNAYVVFSALGVPGIISPTLWVSVSNQHHLQHMMYWEKLHYNDNWSLLWHVSSWLQRGEITHQWNSHEWYISLSS